VVTAVIESTAGGSELKPGGGRHQQQQAGAGQKGGESDTPLLVPGTPAAEASRSPTAAYGLATLQHQLTGGTGDLSRRVSGIHSSLRPSANNSIAGNPPWATGPRSRLVAALTAAANSASMAMSTARSGVASRTYQGPRSGIVRDSAGGQSLAHALGLGQGTEGFPMGPPSSGSYFPGEDDSGRLESSSSKQLQKLPPHDWVHHLYLQPPRDAEVLVQVRAQRQKCMPALWLVVPHLRNTTQHNVKVLSLKARQQADVNNMKQVGMARSTLALTPASQHNRQWGCHSPGFSFLGPVCCHVACHAKHHASLSYTVAMAEHVYCPPALVAHRPAAVHS
jgi:hypothetical protein